MVSDSVRVRVVGSVMVAINLPDEKADQFAQQKV